MSDSDEVRRLFDPNDGTHGAGLTYSQTLAYFLSTVPFRQLQYYYTRAPNLLKLEKRSLVVSFDGACRGNGSAAAKAGYGVYFGPDSPLNNSGCLPANLPQTSQLAELYAATVAIKTIDKLIENDMTISYVILMTDSEEVVHYMADDMASWKKRSFRTSRGKPLNYRDDFERLENLITSMESDGIEVQFWLVPREENREADLLANEGLDKGWDQVYGLDQVQSPERGKDDAARFTESLRNMSAFKEATAPDS